MKKYNYSEARQNLYTLLNTALQEDVLITGKDGHMFKPPLDINGIDTDVTIREILAALRKTRER